MISLHNMKLKPLIIVFCFLFLHSCDTDFDVVAPWQEIVVVYGLLDQSQENQYVRINKAYLGAGDALQMASITDSINYSPEDLLVKLYKIKNGDTLFSLDLDTTLIEKDGGLFSTEANIIYTIPTDTISNFFKNGNLYGLFIKNKRTGNIVTSSTNLISDFSFDNATLGFGNFVFYNPNLTGGDSSKYLPKTIGWEKCNNGKIYQLDVRFNYTENGSNRSLLWSQPLVTFENSYSMYLQLKGSKFFNFLRNNIEKDNSKVREFISLDLIMTVGTQDLETYINVNLPITGIFQERPQFSNINNGIGLFSARYTYEYTGIGLNQNTLNYINDFPNTLLDRNFE